MPNICTIFAAVAVALIVSCASPSRRPVAAPADGRQFLQYAHYTGTTILLEPRDPRARIHRFDWEVLDDKLRPIKEEMEWDVTFPEGHKEETAGDYLPIYLDKPRGSNSLTILRSVYVRANEIAYLRVYVTNELHSKHPREYEMLMPLSMSELRLVLGAQPRRRSLDK
jgi:hypothetical protein